MSVEWLKEMLELDNYAIEELDVVYNGDWSQEGKYQYKITVVHLLSNENFDPKDWPVKATLAPGFYQICESRSGSYHTDWDYFDTQIYKVEPYEVTVTKYRKVDL